MSLIIAINNKQMLIDVNDRIPQRCWLETPFRWRCERAVCKRKAPVGRTNWLVHYPEPGAPTTWLSKTAGLKRHDTACVRKTALPSIQIQTNRQINQPLQLSDSIQWLMKEMMASWWPASVTICSTKTGYCCESIWWRMGLVVDPLSSEGLLMLDDALSTPSDGEG